MNLNKAQLREIKLGLEMRWTRPFDPFSIFLRSTKLRESSKRWWYQEGTTRG